MASTSNKEKSSSLDCLILDVGFFIGSAAPLLFCSCVSLVGYHLPPTARRVAPRLFVALPPLRTPPGRALPPARASRIRGCLYFARRASGGCHRICRNPAKSASDRILRLQCNLHPKKPEN